jgi:molybdopterin-guanine dinucleotide biosynthesis protein A
MNPAMTGLILAGGQGSRMGGADKGLVLLAGRPLVWHVIQRLQHQASSLLLSVNRNVDLYAQFGLPLLTDAPGDAAPTYAGPLAGVEQGLRACKSEWLLVAPCDTPCLPLDLASRLYGHCVAHDLLAAWCTARGDAQVHPLPCLLHRDSLPSLQAFRAKGGASVMVWLRSLSAQYVEFPEPAAFANVNAPSALQPGPTDS